MYLTDRTAHASKRNKAVYHFNIIIAHRRSQVTGTTPAGAISSTRYTAGAHTRRLAGSVLLANVPPRLAPLASLVSRSRTVAPRLHPLYIFSIYGTHGIAARRSNLPSHRMPALRRPARPHCRPPPPHRCIPSRSTAISPNRGHLARSRTISHEVVPRAGAARQANAPLRRLAASAHPWR